MLCWATRQESQALMRRRGAGSGDEGMNREGSLIDRTPLYNKVHRRFLLSASSPSGTSVKQSYKHGIRNREASYLPTVSGELISHGPSEADVTRNTEAKQLAFDVIMQAILERLPQD